jgi:hypothetical protein
MSLGVITTALCSLFTSENYTVSFTGYVPRCIEGGGPGVEDGGQDKREAPYLNYDLNIRRDSRLLGSLQTWKTRRALTMDCVAERADRNRSHDEQTR